MVTMKGLPLAYSKDMQDDKQPVFEAHDLLVLSLAAMAGHGRDRRVRAPSGCAGGRSAGYSTATDLADWLVREADVPFREAHHITGRAVKLAEERGASWPTCRSTRFRQDRSAHRRARVLECSASMRRSRSRTSYGGTAPVRVREQVAAAKEALGL